jgi:HPt (histidine-containing phosphotransfer) domain-containing protein
MDSVEPISLSVDDPTVAALLPRYLERRREDLALLHEALDGGSLDVAVVVGHRMRGSGTAYGIPRITELGTALEKAARSQDIDAVREQAQQLESFLARVRLP